MNCMHCGITVKLVNAVCSRFPPWCFDPEVSQLSPGVCECGLGRPQDLLLSCKSFT